MPAATADDFGVIRTTTGDKGIILTLEAKQSQSRPLDPGSYLVQQWDKVDDSKKADIGKLSKTTEPDKTCLQLLQLCGQMDLETVEYSIFYTDVVCLHPL